MSDHANHEIEDIEIAKRAWELGRYTAPPDLTLIQVPEWDKLSIHHQTLFVQYLIADKTLHKLAYAVANMSIHNMTCRDHGVAQYN